MREQEGRHARKPEQTRRVTHNQTSDRFSKNGHELVLSKPSLVRSIIKEDVIAIVVGSRTARVM
jgi:hypothetical protein